MRTLLLSLVTLLVVTTPCGAAEPASSARSRAAAERVAPALERDLAARGLRLGAPIFVRICVAPLGSVPARERG